MTTLETGPHVGRWDSPEHRHRVPSAGEVWQSQFVFDPISEQWVRPDEGDDDQEDGSP